MPFERPDEEEIKDKGFELGSKLGDLIIDARPDVLAEAINMMSDNTRNALIKAVKEFEKN